MTYRSAYPFIVIVASFLGVQVFAETCEAYANYKDADGVVRRLNLSMWYSDEVKYLRGAIVHSHGMMPVTGNEARAEFQNRDEWRKVAREQGMALIGLRWTGGDPNGDLTTDVDPMWTPMAAKEGIDALADRSGHSELRDAPLAFIGFSAGGGFSLRAAKLLEDRCFAAVHLKSITISYVANAPLSSKVPVFICYGLLDVSRNAEIRHEFRDHRSRFGDPWMMLPDRDMDHTEAGDGSSYGLLFIDSMAKRLVTGGGISQSSARIVPLTPVGSYLGSHSDGGTWQTMFQDAMPSIRAADSYGNDPGFSWIPGEVLAMAWQSVAANSRWGKMSVSFDTATVGRPKTVSLTKGEDVATEIDWYIGSDKVADGDGNMTSWTFTPTSAGVYPIHVRSEVAGVVRSSGLTVIVVDGGSGSRPAWMTRVDSAKPRP